MSERAKIFVRVNTQKCTTDELAEALARQGTESKRVSLVPDALELLNGGAVEHLDAYKKGLFMFRISPHNSAAWRLTLSPEIPYMICVRRPEVKALHFPS